MRSSLNIDDFSEYVTLSDAVENCSFSKVPVDLSGQALFNYMNQEMSNSVPYNNVSTNIEYSSQNTISGAKITDLKWKIPTRQMMRSLYGDTRGQPDFEEGDLTKELIDEVGEANITDWECKGCAKFFSTKASLKRHHDRKLSCKQICENKIVAAQVESKDYIIDWVDKLLQKSVSGENEKPYCKHCDVEFANKSNLHKHLSKSPACDTLAKNAFLDLMKPKPEEPISEVHVPGRGFSFFAGRSDPLVVLSKVELIKSSHKLIMCLNAMEKGNAKAYKLYNDYNTHKISKETFETELMSIDGISTEELETRIETSTNLDTLANELQRLSPFKAAKPSISVEIDAAAKN